MSLRTVRKLHKCNRKKDTGKYIFKLRCNWEAEVNKVKQFWEAKGGYTEKARRFGGQKEDCNDRVMEVVVSENSKMREQTKVNVHIRNLCLADSLYHTGTQSHATCHYTHTLSRIRQKYPVGGYKALKLRTVFTNVSNDKCLRSGLEFAPSFRHDRRQLVSFVTRQIGPVRC